MRKEQLQELLKTPETHNLELKESLHSEQKISQLICSFANTNGGILIIGANDNGVVVGFNENPDKLQQRLSSCSQAVSPAPLTDIELHTFDGKHVVVLEVHKADSTILYTYKGIVYVRVGSTTKKVEGHTMVEFLKNKQILCFDELTAKAALTDIDEKKIQQYLALRNSKDYLKTRTIQQFLISQNLVSENGSVKIKNATLLLFGKNPQQHFPQCLVKVVRFRGTEPVEVISNQEFEGCLSDQIEQVYGFILKNISKKIVVDKELPKRTDIYEYPLPVLREAITNAIVHRDYFNINSIQINIFDDRMEFINPGSIPAELSKELFGKLSVQRNPITYRILKDLKYIEGLGIGIPKMINEMRKMNLSDPEFMWTDSFFKLTLKNISSAIAPIDGINDLNQRQLRALEYLKQNKTIKTKTYASMNKVSPPMALIDIRELLNFGYLKKVGQYRGAYYILNEDKFK